MTLNTIVEASNRILIGVVDPALRNLILAGVAGFMLLLFRVKSTAQQLFAWTLVLYAAVAMPMLSLVLPQTAVSIPALIWQAEPQHSAETPSIRVSVATSSVGDSQQVTSSDSSPTAINSQQLESAPEPVPDRPVPPIPWTTVALMIYVLGTIVLLSRMLIGVVLCGRVIGRAEAIPHPRVMEGMLSLARSYRLKVVPRAMETECVSVPLTLGVFRPTILLPADWGTWDDAKLGAVLAHEMSHVARRDALTQRVSLLHCAIFWFSPLAWWLDHKLSTLAEQASDEASLAGGVNRSDYAKTLLEFFEALQTSPGRVWWQGVSMARAGQAERRVEKILAWKGAVTMSLKRSFAVAIIVAAVPLVYFAASVRAAGRIQSADANPNPVQETPAAAASPTVAPTPAVAPSAATTYVNVESVPSPAPAAIAGTVPPMAPVAGGVAHAGPQPVPPMAPPALAGPAHPLYQDSYGIGHGYSYAYGNDEDERFVIVSGSGDSVTMSGSSEDVHHAKRLKRVIPGDFIWFERDEKSYIIRDQATVDRARKFWAGQEELGKKQEALGKQQEELGKQQSALGEQMQQVKVNVPDMTADLDRLKTELKELSSGATVEQVGRIQSEIGELQSRIGELQSHAGQQQSKIGREMSVLGEQQGKLGQQQGELGRQQGELAREAARKMRQLLDESLKNGTAQPEPTSEEHSML